MINTSGLLFWATL